MLGAFVMYLMHVVLLNISVESRRNHIHNGLTLVGFLPIECEEDNRTVPGIDEQERRGYGTICLASELLPSETFQCTTISFRSSLEADESRAWGIQSISDGFRRGHIECIEVIASSAARQKLVLGVLSY